VTSFFRSLTSPPPPWTGSAVASDLCPLSSVFRLPRTKIRNGIAACLALALLTLSQPARATDRTWANTGTDFNTGASWGGTAPGAGDRAIFNAAEVTQPNLSSSLSIASLDFSVAAASGYDLTSSSTAVKLTLTSVVTGTSGAINSSANTGSNTIDAPIILGGAAASTQTFTQVGSGTLILNGVISSTNSITLSLSGAGTFNLNGANTYSGTTSWVTAGNTTVIGNSAAFGNSTINFTQSNTFKAGVDLTGVNKITNAITISNNPTFNNNLGFNLELSGNVDMGGATRTLTSNTGTTTFGGIISNDGGGGLALTTVSGGIFVLNGTNTYTGITNINGSGKVSVATIGNSGSNGPLGSASTISFGTGGTAGGTLLYTGSGETTNRTINLIGSNATGGGVESSGTGALVLSGTFTNSGTVAKTFTLSGTSAAANELQSIVGDGGSSVTSLTKSGTGTWVLSGANTFTGKTSILNGTLSVVSLNSVVGGAATSNLGHPITVANGTINFGSTTTTGQLTYTGTGETTDRVINLNGTTGGATIDQSGTGLLKFTSNTTAPGQAATDERKTLTLQGSTAGTGEISGNIVDSSSGTAGQLATSVTKAGTGTWTLSGANTYSGLTTVTAGTLNATNDASLGNSIGATAGLSMNPSSGTATVNFTSTTPAIASLASSGAGTSNVVLGNTTTPAATTLTVGGGNTSTVFSGTISDSIVSNPASIGNLTKTGTGTLTLSGANTYTGTTLVGTNGGILKLDNNNTTTPRLVNTSGITVNSGGSLLLAQSGGTSSTDRINNGANVTLNSGGSPGAGGKLNTGGLSEGIAPTGGGGAGGAVGALTLTMNTNSVIDFTNANGGSILVFQNFSLASGTAITIDHWTGSANTNGLDKLLFVTNPGYSLTDLANVQFTDDAGGNFALGAQLIDFNGYSELVPVPEPSTWIGAALALVAIGWTQRRRFLRKSPVSVKS